MRTADAIYVRHVSHVLQLVQGKWTVQILCYARSTCPSQRTKTGDPVCLKEGPHG